MVLDIVGLLISVPEFIWTIINFFLLMFLLKKFLYDPILKVMDERKAQIEADFEVGRTAEKALAENSENLKTELAKSGAEAREMISEARGVAEKAKGEVVNAAHAEAAGIHKDVRQRVAAEEVEARKTVEDSMPELVALLSQQLLHSEEASEDAELINNCINTAKE